MIRKFAIALIATTMLVAPALAADAVKSTPAAPVAAATTTTAPAVTPASKDATKNVAKTITKTATKTEHRKTIKVAHRHVHHLMVAKSHTSASHVKTAKVTKPVKTVMARPAASPVTLFPWTAPKTEHVKTEHHKTIKVAHRHVHHLMVAKNHTPASHMKTAKVTKPAVKTVNATPAVSTATPAAAKPAVKVIKADRVIKKIKVANRHGHHLTVAKSHKPASQVKTVNVSKPVKHANVGKTQGQVAHEVKSNKVIAN
jgi:hypothetical protein